mmetsp:Transcript_57499/g.153599  ORF Transcript_57499/g.153599 Transcript_57499/m.153599 type:complete len:248 (+) Transcript_57499:121-864(+)
MAAARSGRTEMVLFLVQHRANTDARDKEHGRSALIWAACNGHSAIVRLLIAAKADPEMRSAPSGGYGLIGTSPLYEAASAGHADVASVLLESHVDLESADRNRETPLMCASKNGHAGVVRLLFRARADCSRCNMFGRTAADLALQAGHKGIHRLLVASPFYIVANIVFRFREEREACLEVLPGSTVQELCSVIADVLGILVPRPQDLELWDPKQLAFRVVESVEEVAAICNPRLRLQGAVAPEKAAN